MALLGFIGTRDKSETAPDARDSKPTEAPVDKPPPSADPTATQGASPTNPPENSSHTHSPASGTPPVSKTNESETPPTVADQSDSATRADVMVSPDSQPPRRFAFPGQFKRLRTKPGARLSPVEKPGATAPASSTDKAKKKKPLAVSSSNADRRAKQSALVVRSLIVGQDTDQGGLASPQVPISSTQLKNVKGQLLKPKTAGKLIAQLRALPALANSAERASAPIQAVCLSSTDEEVDEQHLSRLRTLKSLPPPPNKTTTVGSSPAAGPTIDSLAEAFRNLHVINLFQAPDLGLGQPGDGPGLLAGAVPTAETVINGLTQVTPQLMALGYATGRAVIPDHNGIYPPTDRLSVLTYWWGLEVLLPPPTLAHLSRVESISATIINFLTALGVMYEGVREILPFVRYFSQYIDFEFKAIKAQDRGKGVICAATWIMPAAMVPRPWDFPDPPKSLQLHTQVTPSPIKAPVTAPPSQAAPPAPLLSLSKAAQGSPASPLPPVQNPVPISA